MQSFVPDALPVSRPPSSRSAEFMRAARRSILALILIEHKIANLRKRRGLTQAALARRSGVSQPMIAQIESGKLNNLTLKTLARTARALGASLKIDLISRSESSGRRKHSSKSRVNTTSHAQHTL